MKRISLLVVILIFIISSCAKDPAVNAKKEGTDSQQLSFNDSYNAWISYKKKINNGYTYTNTWVSFTGFGAELKTSVANGKIIARDYTAYQYVENSSEKNITKQWHEDETSINTHANDAADALTLDGIYSKAKNVWLKADPKKNYIYFETKNNGLISSCGYVPIGCQDDCFTGINVSSIIPL